METPLVVTFVNDIRSEGLRNRATRALSYIGLVQNRTGFNHLDRARQPEQFVQLYSGAGDGS